MLENFAAVRHSCSSVVRSDFASLFEMLWETLQKTNALGWEVWWMVEIAKPRRKVNCVVSNG